MQNDKNKNLIQFNEKNQPDAMKFCGMSKIKGQITKSHLLVDSANIKNVIECLTLQVKTKYKGILAQNILKRFSTILTKKILNLQKNWFIFDDDNGSIGYYGLLWHKKGQNYLIGVYEFSIQFTINKDMYIKRFQSYSQSKSFLGGTDKVYVIRDSTQMKSRGLANQDVNLLISYSNIMQNDFSTQVVANKM